METVTGREGTVEEKLLFASEESRSRRRVESLLKSFIITLLSSFLYWCYEIYRKNKVLEAIPGPLCIPFIGYKLPTDIYGIAIFFNELFQKYGKTVKLYIGNNLHVITCDVNVIEALMKSTVHIEKSDSYNLITPWLKEGLLTASGKKWKLRRKYIAPSFKFGAIKCFFPIFKENVDILVKKLEEECDKENPCNVIKFFSNYGLDILGETSFGIKLNIQKGQFGEYSKAAHRLLEIVLIRMFSVWKRIDLLFKLFAKEYKEAQKSVNLLNATARKIIQQYKTVFNTKNLDSVNEPIEDENKKKINLINALMQHPELNDVDIEEEVNTFMFAGHDTTSSFLSFALLELSKRPDIQENLFNEINSYIHNDFNNLTEENLQEMKYLDQVIKEVLRFRTIVPFVERKLHDNAKLGDYVIPKGTIITVNIYSTHHNTDYYKEPEKFDPERFGRNNSYIPPKFAFIPFSAGPRNCIGQKYAVLEIKTAMVRIIMEFKLHIAKNFNLILGMAAVLRSKHGFPIILEKRIKKC